MKILDLPKTKSLGRGTVPQRAPDFRLIAENIPHTVWMTDANGQNHYQNRAWYAYVGGEPGSSFGEDWLDFYHPEDRELLMREWTRARASNGEYLYDIKVRIRRHDGNYRWFHVKGAPVREPSGTVIEWVGTCTDIHDQPTMRALGNKNAGTEPPAVFEWNILTGKILVESDSYLSMLGVRRVPKQPWARCALIRQMHPDSRSAFKAAMSAAMRTRFPLRIAAYLCASGQRTRIIDIAGVFQFDNKGRPEIFLGTVTQQGNALADNSLNSLAPRGGLAGWQIRRVIDHMENRLDQRVRLEQLARLASLSPFHFSRAFKLSTGMPPSKYFKKLRVERAKYLLLETDDLVTEIAIAVGYDSTQALTRAFRHEVGDTPARFRRFSKR